ncbi:LysR family transcriptional regulator [Acidovorax cavernicola]|uniref:LysR family transcriptional regulator n=1 Tax=Acidovorax cavernicola TaxID=1675792 RepID=A0A9X8GWX3_9BURK|nr:LysR substrate-binding domain-containing protein [Acidovorax cavernicola]RIX84716.1 LysR family transcriptional regulator [Acidovorax cavernicola]
MKRSLHLALPSIDSLIVFEQAAHFLSFTKAGQHLGLTQSAVSRQMIDLEALLQVALFTRDKRRVQLTPAGGEFREMVRPIVRDLRSATLRMRFRQAQTGVLNLSVAASFCNLWLIPRLPRYYRDEAAPRVNVTPHVGAVRFGDGQFDAAIVNADRPPPDCESIRLLDIELAPYGATALLAELKAGRLQDLPRIPALDLREGEGAWLTYLSQVGLPHIPVDYVGSNSMLWVNHEAALAGLGIALLPSHFVEREVTQGRLVRLHPATFSIGRSYYYCWPSHQAKSEAVQHLGNWLKDSLVES